VSEPSSVTVYLSAMRDTTPAAERVRTDAIRRLAPTQRLAEALELSESVRALALSRLRALHADRTDFELVELLVGAPLLPASRGPAA
jgi:hypothetical protein